MAIEGINTLIDSIQGVFKGRDSKKVELQKQEESLLKSVEDIKSSIDRLSYKALIEGDKKALKEYESLKEDLGAKERELEFIQEKFKALDKFEADKDMTKKALEIYKGTQKEIDARSKELGKATTDYYKAKAEMVKAAKIIIDLHQEINLLPLEIKSILDIINPEDIGKTKEDIEEYKKNLRDPRHYLDLFEDTRLKHIDNKVSRAEISQVLNGDIKINPYYPAK